MTISLTTRLGLHRWSVDTDPWDRSDFDADNATLEAAVVVGAAGVAAARPAVGIGRALYLATDSHRTFVDDGTTWRELADLGTANTWAATQTMAAVVVNGGITAADATLEVGSALAVSGLVTASAGVALPNGQDLTVGTGTGSKIGQAGSKLAFYGATPVVKPAAYTLTTTADRTQNAYAANAQTTVYTGTPADAASTAKLADLNALRVGYENLRAYTEDVAALVAAAVTDLKTLGLLG